MDGGIPRGPHEPKKIPQQLLHFCTQCVILHLVCNFTLSVSHQSVILHYDKYQVWSGPGVMECFLNVYSPAYLLQGP